MSVSSSMVARFVILVVDVELEVTVVLDVTVVLEVGVVLGVVESPQKSPSIARLKGSASAASTSACCRCSRLSARRDCFLASLRNLLRRR